VDEDEDKGKEAYEKVKERRRIVWMFDCAYASDVLWLSLSEGQGSNV